MTVGKIRSKIDYKVKNFIRLRGRNWLLIGKVDIMDIEYLNQMIREKIFFSTTIRWEQYTECIICHWIIHLHLDWRSHSSQNSSVHTVHAIITGFSGWSLHFSAGLCCWDSRYEVILIVLCVSLLNVVVNSLCFYKKIETNRSDWCAASV